MNTLPVRVVLSLVVVLIIGCAIDSIQAAGIARVDAIDAAEIAILDIADQTITPETQALQIIENAEIAYTQSEIDSMGPIESRIEIATIDIAEEIQIIGRSDIGETAQVIRRDIAGLDLIAQGVINDLQVIEI